MIVKGQKINDRYEIVRNIGEGGMANVYLAYDTILNREVAVKILRGDLADDEKFVRRFQREAISASSLTHPNIVEMYDVGEDNGQYFIVMEYIDGKTLKSLIKKRGTMGLPETIDIMLQLTSAIACAHDSYIIHRDIKPQNVMILDDGTVKIMDFGIATALNSTELTQTNTVMGSVHYLPPEQANGKGATVKSDIYSLGILMYEMLIGKVPFKGDNAVEIAMKQMNQPIPSVIKQNEDIPQSIENIILKATAKNPKNRYDSANEMYDDLKNALAEEHLNDRRITYTYPEQDMEDTRVVKNNVVTEEKQKNNNSEKKLNKGIIITGSICVAMAIILAIVVLIIPKLTTVPDVAIPNIKGLSLADAEKSLTEVGFYLTSTPEEKYDSSLEEGKVIGVKNYNIGDVVKKGKTLTIIISKGTNEVEIGDYLGKTYQEVQAELEKAGLQVIIETQSTTDKDSFKQDVIVKQSIEKGTKLTEGDIIRLYIQTLEEVYPDFIKDNYSLDVITMYCEEHGITLETVYEETNKYTEGTIIKQSRSAGSVVKNGQTLTITVAKIPTSNAEG